MWSWDPGKTIPDPESRGQKGTGSRIRISNTDSTFLPVTRGYFCIPQTPKATKFQRKKLKNIFFWSIRAAFVNCKLTRLQVYAKETQYFYVKK
jgi:hypothetical protein